MSDIKLLDKMPHISESLGLHSSSMIATGAVTYEAVTNNRYDEYFNKIN